ncbi:hypothetical protein [Streptomyces sp. Ac-502]|uniref:hypothetical protein n=1 Tax=Streptomyces sp. Ac-502 TaxID=3342801 RepID=UPI00386249D0
MSIPGDQHHPYPQPQPSVPSQPPLLPHQPGAGAGPGPYGPGGRSTIRTLKSWGLDLGLGSGLGLV